MWRRRVPPVPNMPTSSTGDPVHEEPAAERSWSRVNMAEALPGVQTPLTWTFWAPAIELGMRGAFCDLGIIRASAVRVPEAVDDRVNGIFYGRPAVNPDTLTSLVGNRAAGSADA